MYNTILLHRQAIEVADLYDHQGKCNLDLEFARCSWRFKVNRLLQSLTKAHDPTASAAFERGMFYQLLILGLWEYFTFLRWRVTSSSFVFL